MSQSKVSVAQRSENSGAVLVMYILVDFMVHQSEQFEKALAIYIDFQF